jgi:hypothetical protein
MPSEKFPAPPAPGTSDKRPHIPTVDMLPSFCKVVNPENPFNPVYPVPL